MKAPPERPSGTFATKVSPQELGQIITLRKNLDLMGALGKFAEQYLLLGWSLAALDARTGKDLGLDFTGPQRNWIQSLMDESLKGREINLAVHTGSRSRLLVVKFDPEAGPRHLDPFGPWRSACVAQNTAAWEQHFYLLPSGWNLPNFQSSGIEVLGEGGVALTPPSLTPDLKDTWRWLQAPWKCPPCPPPPGLLRFLEKSGLLSTPVESLFSWQETIARIAGHKELLSALLTPQASMARYYQKIITEALKAGISEPEMLQTLLWQAPHGDARLRPECWRGLLKVVAEVARITGSLPTSPGPNREQPETEKHPRQTLLQRLERLTARTRELERQLAALRPAMDTTVTREKTQEEEEIPLWEEWLTLIHRPSLDDKEAKKFQAAVSSFLKANPDLSGDEGKLQMVLYSYANYVRGDPANEGLPYEQKLAKAGDLARKILRTLAF